MSEHLHLAHTIHKAHTHLGWDRTIEPVQVAKSGDRLLFECRDAAGGHFDKDSTTADIARMDPDAANPVTGPVYVEGAEPGDALKIRIEEFIPSGFGWTAILPGFGLLADQFQEPALKLWSYEPSGKIPAVFSDMAEVPLRPFVGTIGVAPAAPECHSVIPPRRVGGNMDIRDLTAGAVLYLPVEVPGALLSIGDTHAAQGDGEVCGTAIESAMDMVVCLEVIKNAAPRTPRFVTDGSSSRHLDGKGYIVTTGIGDDLMQASRDSVSAMIDLLSHMTGMPAEDAYMLSSVCGDLRISEIVDAPNWVVSFYFPRLVLG
ncbi:acetamidase/formamidase family protein [Roseibium salinum]|uniref:Acetamidase/formamidase family protein n=1 Tax=Roseibium salinum TaxID=1604349 RepID=A0ABT3QXU2_9HYPH|nr:acetamidase/formamidase family protein [Roseibium sp. DSM 29163]MCX2721764.1 acetamidase/formamidase family protein [Roseibium sp. DSM 29163]MDN3720190.1 acetamidase/formamidase family protein [Roseibium salinum]